MRDAISTDRRVIILGFARMAEAFGNAFLLVVLPLYIVSAEIGGATFGLSESFMAGILLSLTGLIASGGQPLLGYVSDMVRKRRVFIVAGLVVLALTDLIYIAAATYLALFAIRFVQGLGNMLTVPTTIALINEYSEPGTRGENMGIYTTLRMVGTGLGPVAAGLIVDGGPYANPLYPGRELTIEGTDIAVTVMTEFSGFDAAFIVAALGTALSALLVTGYVFDPENIGPNRDRTARPSFGIRGVRAIDDPVYHVSLGALVFGINLALMLSIQPQVNARLGQSATMFGIQLVAFGAPLLLLGPIFGAVSDRVGRRTFLLTGIALLVPTTLAQGLVTTPEGMIVARLGAGLAAALAFAPAVALIGDVVTDGDSGTKLSLLTMSLGMGMGVSPMIAGFLVQFGYRVPFLFGTAIAILITVLGVIFLPETLNEEDRRPIQWRIGRFKQN